MLADAPGTRNGPDTSVVSPNGDVKVKGFGAFVLSFAGAAKLKGYASVARRLGNAGADCALESPKVKGDIPDVNSEDAGAGAGAGAGNGAGASGSDSDFGSNATGSDCGCSRGSVKAGCA